MTIPLRSGRNRDRYTPRRIPAFVAAMVVLGALPATLGAQGGTRSAAILILRGNDTVVVERVQRSDTLISAVIAAPMQPRITLDYTLGADHAVTNTRFLVHGANSPVDAAPLQSGSARIVGDSAVLELRTGAGVRAMTLPTRAGALPLMNNDFVIWEQLVRLALARGATRLTVPLFALSGAQTIDGTVELVGRDSARFRIASNVTEVAIDAAGNVTGGTLPAQGLRIVVIEGAAAASISLGKPDYSAPAGAPYTAEEVVVYAAAGHSLAGTLTRPSGVAGRVPAVITITGSGSQDRDEFIPFAGGVRIFRQVADTLGRRGIAVLRLDDRGVGGSGGDIDGTSADFADDIRAAVAFLRARSDIDPARIALVGHSEGGAIAPMVAATDPKLAAIVLMAGPAYSGRRIIDYQLDNLVRGNGSIPASAKDSLIAAQRAQFDTTIGKVPWMQFFLEYDPLPTARKVNQPVLILQGATDQQIRPEEARLLERTLREAGNSRVTTTIFAERNHLFLHDPVGHPSGYTSLTDPRLGAEVLGALADWLVTTLRAR